MLYIVFFTKVMHSDQNIALRTLFVCSLLFSFVRTSTTNTLDTISPNQYIRGDQTLVSAGGTFQLGFFSPGKLTSRYLGIWYTISNEIVVWVANRETPLDDSSGVLKVTDQGVLVLLNSSNGVVWSSNSSRTVDNPVSQLLDSGNLVVKNANETNPDNFLWQSFDYPCDTFLPEMKLGWDFVTGLERYVSSWKSTEDPARGEFSLRMTPYGLPQLVVMKGAKIKTRSGSSNGLRLTGSISRPNPLSEFEFFLNKDEVYYEYRLLNKSMLSRYALNPFGIAQWFTWIENTHSWEPFFSTQQDQCEIYAFCGSYSSCNISNAPVCTCLKGFIPKSPEQWNSQNWSDGCVRNTPLSCSYNDGFFKYTSFKLPDTSSSWFDKSKSLKECKGLCLENCSCTSYANLDIRDGGSGCLLWFGDLTDIRTFQSDSQDLYIRLASSELDDIEKKSKFNKKRLAGIVISSVLFLVGMLIVGFILYIRKKKLRNQVVRRKDYLGEDREDMELPLFDLNTIVHATNGFSSRNKLGEGGFGPVYQGTLIGGKEIAVKRLSKDSGQGTMEFKNEVILIAKLQHRNLVKVLGCCTQDDEKILIYEFMANRSLDFFIFDQERAKLLDWPMYFHIINGIARGLLYLHQDSRLRIIHRDLKASNILLDDNMNPKISDFGLAKIFGGDQSQANTNRVVGTYGYMPPEYAVDGIFSTKSDVFSFGVVLLEILSRQRNRGFWHPDHHLNLLGHAWTLWIQNTPLELIDKSLSDSCTISEVLRCLHVALLCVQQVPEDRPSMSSVVLMLSSEVALLPPKQPGFYTERTLPDDLSRARDLSENNFSTTLLKGR
ncbi:G-type lectin S-receptor-like serine/threonine-protein kinase At4g27290 isoform X1 [Prunus persica]|uniref:G-type lectin S-receptor-like serine/threonine-protein kinase At4g27290 isoform X1 n=1 Tax=Prunus persica TaxID=3760 RepID=UPI0009AB4248|nr:G-type lectin S-receptor-like serine/threonine-protein kinase At4g27290 isoform X1 [Prunus persica]